MAFGIGELSRRSGVHIETIRYYERTGMTPRADRRGRYRQYNDTDADRLLFIRRARSLGFAPENIRTLLAISGGEGGCDDGRAIASLHLAVVRKQILELQQMETLLLDAVAACDAPHSDGCPVVETLLVR